MSIYEKRPWIKNYDDGVNPDLEIPDISYTDAIRDALKKFSANMALYFMGVAISFNELDKYSNQFANFLLENGCEPERDVVGINLPNIPQYVIAHLGTLKAGCAASGVSPLLLEKEIKYQLGDCSAKSIITLDAVFENRIYKKPAAELDTLKNIVVTNVGDFLPKIKQILGKLFGKIPKGKIKPIEGKKIIKFMDLIKEYKDTDPNIKVPPDALALVQYTGGTTGLPKGTMLTHRNILSNVLQADDWLKFQKGKDIMLSGFPFFHLAGLLVCQANVYFANTQILIPNPRDVNHICKEFKKYKPTLMANVPTLYQLLINNPKFRKLDFSQLRIALSGAAPFPAESIRELEAIIGENKVVEVYGMTEASPLVTMNPRVGLKKIGKVGLPLQKTIVKIVDVDTGEELPLGQEGEIIIKGPQVMKGYLNKPEETAHALRDGWFFSGDVGRMDEDGYIEICDRTKDMIIVGGYKVFSRELEEKLYEHPAIELVATVGIPNPNRPGSEIVKAFIVLNEEYKDRDTKELEKEIIAWSKENMAPYKVPKLIEFRKELPLTLVGKVYKKGLRDEARK
ncbi:MAG: long-chain-fatty-acid--CoA ligase [Candidatus Helarchaeota archaeon]